MIAAAKLPGPSTSRCRHFAGNAESSQRGARRNERVRFDRQCGSDQRRAGAAHRRHQTHQRIAVSDHRVTRAIGYPINAAGDGYDRRMGLGKARRCVARGIVAVKALANSAALRRTIAGPRVSMSRANCARGGARSTNTGSSTQGLRPAFAAANRRFDCLAAFGIERAEIDEQGISAGDERCDLFRRNRHRRHRAGREQHIGRKLLRHAVGDAMHARCPRSQTCKQIGGDVGKLDRGVHFIYRVH